MHRVLADTNAYIGATCTRVFFHAMPKKVHTRTRDYRLLFLIG